MPSANRPTKAELKRARVEAARAALARERRRSRNIRIGVWSGVAVVVLAVVVTTVVVLNRSGTPHAGAPASTVAPASTANAVGRTTDPPWTAPADATGAVSAARLTMLGQEGSAQHIHAHLDVIVNGSPVQVPADIGIDNAQQKISPLHTHDATGVIHVESPDKSATYSLGQFFTEWQVSLGSDRLGGLTTDATHHLKAYVDGKPYTGDPAAIVLAAHDEIAIAYGTDAQTASVPGSYQWTSGL